MSRDTELDPKRILILLVIPVIAGIITTVAGGYFLGTLKEREPQLIYQAPLGTFFPGECGEQIAVYTVTLENDGMRSADAIAAQISFNDPVIEYADLRIDPSIAFRETETNRSYRLDAETFNPGDGATITIFAKSTGHLPDRPKVSLRGKGVSGIERPPRAKEDAGMRLPWILLVVVGATLASSAIINYRNRNDAKSFLGGADEREILSSFCMSRGLYADARYYDELPRPVSYWHESDRFVLMALQNADPGETAKRKGVLTDLLESIRGLTPISRSIIHYNISRLAVCLGQDTEASDHMAEAVRLNADIVRFRQEAGKK